MRRISISLLIWTVRAAYAIARRLPIRERVIFATSHTAAIRGDLAAIRTELAARRPDVPVVALIHDRRPGFRGRVRGLLQSVQAAYHLATARVFIVDSHFLPLYVIRRRPGTRVVQTWHACGAIKKIGYSVVEASFGADELLTRLVRIHSNYDLCLAASDAAVEQYVDAFRQPAELFVTDIGMPRTDVLRRPGGTTELEQAIRARYRIPEGRRVVLYAPTFRGTSLATARDPANLDLEALQGVLGADHVVLLRAHPAVRARSRPQAGLHGFVIDVSDYPEVNELLLVTDVLVTDYSSIIFDFALLGRPMVFFAPDLRDYDQERGFYFDYRAGVPGPVFETTGDVAAWLRSGEWDEDRVQTFARRWFRVADGRASARFVDRIVLPALAGHALERQP